jgi:lysophospholipase L1-like esterase
MGLQHIHILGEEEKVMRSVFVLGDSISIHYGPYLQEKLAPSIAYDRKRGTEDALKDLNLPVGANGGDSGMVLTYLEEQKEQNVRYDILLVNCGLHDIKTDPLQSSKQISIDNYEDNLKQICALSNYLANRLIWVRTTPLIDEIHNRLNPSFHRFHKDVIEYNAVADTVMKQNNVPILDLHTFTVNLGHDIYCDHVHFKDNVREEQAAYIAKQLVNMM